MPTRVLYHCPCSTDFSSSFGPVQPSSSSFQLSSLYFCEECNSIRCDQCTTKDLTAYYCPNCLFDVPLASIKTERAKCPRNCFSCPICTSTLSVVASDPSQQAVSPLLAEASVGEPPWYLACPTCKWDSKEVGLTFEKPTGLSLQVQRLEDNAADVHEFNQLRAHFDTYLRMSVDSTSSSLTAARSSKLLRDVPSLVNDPLFAPNRRQQKKKIERDEDMPPYKASMTWDAGREVRRYVGVKQGLEDGKALGVGGRQEQSQFEFSQEQQNDAMISDLRQRWSSPADQSLQKADLGACRMPLRTKQTKRCSVCRHIIIRPDTKPTSSRFKIRLLALNHLPEIHIRPPNTTMAASGLEDRRRSAFASMGRRKVIAVDAENLQAGRSYVFEASFLNPLDDPMVVRLHIARPPSATLSSASYVRSSTLPTKPSTSASSKFSWTVTPTSSQFPVNAFNAVWELDDEDSDLLEPSRRSRRTDGLSDEDDIDEEDEDGLLADDREHKRSRTDLGGTREGRKKGQGILRRKGHETVIGLELALSRDAVGEVEFPMQVTFSYRPDAEGQQRGTSASDANKSFSFWTFVRLGRVITDSPNAGAIGGHAVSSPSGGSSFSTTEARRSALDKRRSVMGLNLSNTTPPSKPPLAAAPEGHPTSPLSSLKEATIAAEDGSPRRKSSYGPERRSSSLALGTDASDGQQQELTDLTKDLDIGREAKEDDRAL